MQISQNLMILKFKEWLLDPHRRVSVHKLRVKYFVTCYNFRDYFFIVTSLGRNVRFIFCFSLFLYRNCVYPPFINERESRVSTITIFFQAAKKKGTVPIAGFFFKFRKTNAPIYIRFWIHNSSKYFWKNCIKHLWDINSYKFRMIQCNMWTYHCMNEDLSTSS